MTKRNKFKITHRRGFRFIATSSGMTLSGRKQKQVFIHYHRSNAEDLRDAEVGDAAYENYLRDPSGARPLDDLMAEWDALDAEREKARR